MLISEWMPPELDQEAIVRDALEDGVQRWAKRWFVEPAVKIVSTTPFAPVISSGSPRWSPSEHPLVAVRDRSRARLLALALGVATIDTATLGSPGGDEAVLSGYFAAIVNDLAVSVIGRLAGVTDPETRTSFDSSIACEADVLLVIGDNLGGWLLSVRVPHAALVRTRRQTAPAAKGRNQDLVSRKAAIASSRIAVDAVVQSLPIALADVHGLAPGDVILLERSAGEALDLVLAKTGQIVTSGKLNSSAASHTLLIDA